MICLSINVQEEELKEKNGKIEKAEHRLTTLNLELKVCFLDYFIMETDFCLSCGLIFSLCGTYKHVHANAKH